MGPVPRRSYLDPETLSLGLTSAPAGSVRRPVNGSVDKRACDDFTAWTRHGDVPDQQLWCTDVGECFDPNHGQERVRPASDNGGGLLAPPRKTGQASSWTSDDGGGLAPPPTTGQASSRTSDDGTGLASNLGRRGRPRLGPRTTGEASSRTTGEASPPNLGRRGMPRLGPRTTGEASPHLVRRWSPCESSWTSDDGGGLVSYKHTPKSTGARSTPIYNNQPGLYRN